MAAFNPWEQYNQGLQNLGQTISTLNTQDMQRNAQERQNSLADLQIQQGETALADTAAKQAGLQTAYGVETPEDAYAKQYQVAQSAETQKQMSEKMKMIMDGFKHFEGAVKDNTMDGKTAKEAFHATMKYGGIDLAGSGINVDFGTNGGFYSGPVSKSTLIRMNGKVVPYNNDGIVEKMKVVGSDPQTNAPIFEATKETVFKENAKPQETWSDPYEIIVGGKKAQVQKSSTGRVQPVVQDTSTTIIDRKSGETKPGKVLPAGQLEALSDASQILKTLSEAQGISGNVDTGPIAGRWQSLKQFAGMSSDNFNQLKQKISTVENIMLKLRSGAAVTEQEYKRFLNEMPTVNDDEKILKTKFANATKYMEELLDGKLATYEEGGYKVPSGVKDRSKALNQPQTIGGYTVKVKGAQ